MRGTAATCAGTDGGTDDFGNGSGEIDSGTSSIRRPRQKGYDQSGTNSKRTGTYNRVVATWEVNVDGLEVVGAAAEVEGVDVEAVGDGVVV